MRGPSRAGSAAVVLSAAALVLAGGAGAVGSGRWICGPHGSAQVPSSYEGNVPIFAGAGGPLHGQKTTGVPLQPFYRIGFGESRSCAVIGAFGSAYFIPASGEVRTNSGESGGHALWIKLSAKLADRLRKLVAKVKPYPAPKKVRQVIVDDRISGRPSSYLRLYSIGAPVKAAPAGTHWQLIDLEGAYTPWTDGKNVLGVSKTGGYLERDGQIARIPASVAKLIRRAAPIPK